MKSNKLFTPDVLDKICKDCVEYCGIKQYYKNIPYFKEETNNENR